MYKEIKPSNRLVNIVDSFWAYSNNDQNEQFKVLPDTCTDFIFNLSHNKSIVSGIMTNYQFKNLDSSSSIIGIRFKTEKLGALSKIPFNETKNLDVDLLDIIPTYNSSVLSQINDLDSVNERVEFLENFISNVFIKYGQKQDDLILNVVKEIRFLKGIVDIRLLAKSYYISLRQLERRFKKYMGLTIKEFSNIVRFNSAKTAIEKLVDKSLTEIAFDRGFFDHPHMNYEFNRLSGENPSYFR